MEQLQLHYHWESMSFNTHNVLRKCHECQMFKGFQAKTQYQLVKPGWAWHTVLIDIVGPLPASTCNLIYIIVAINHLTKWVELKAIADLGAVNTLKFFINQIIHQHGCPQVVLTDNGTSFTLQIVPRLNEQLGIRGVISTLYNPETNGVLVRVYRTLANILRKLVVGSPANWPTLIGAAAFSYNISFHSSTGHLPF